MSRNKRSCLADPDMIGKGENSYGSVNVTVNTDESADDMLGRQQWTWGEPRDGKRFSPYGWEEPQIFPPSAVSPVSIRAKRRK